MIENIAIRRREIEMRDRGVWGGGALGLFELGAEGHGAVGLSDQARALSRGLDGLADGVLAQSRERILQLSASIYSNDLGIRDSVA